MSTPAPSSATEMCEERYRLVVLGSAKVGKTNLIRRYLYNEFSTKYKETIEDLHSREFRIQGVPLPLDILDTNFNFPDMRRLAISSASAFLLVFAVDDVTSFKEMSDLWQEICARRPDLNELPIVVVGNKCDVETKKIYEATAMAFISRLSADVRYLEVSAKDNLRVTEVFRTLLELSGFPRCKAGGGALDDVTESDQDHSPSLRRANTVRAKPMKREIFEQRNKEKDKEKEKNGPASARELDKQVSQPGLTIPQHIGDLKRNLSLRMKPNRKEKDKDNGHAERKLSDDSSKLSRSSSLIRRTKHLSLKMRRHGEKINDDKVDESDCKIS